MINEIKPAVKNIDTMIEVYPMGTSYTNFLKMKIKPMKKLIHEKNIPR
jgi:hypothetical protein